MTRLGPTDYRAPPRLARMLLALRVPREEREFVKGDLDEGHAAQLRRHGAGAARLWYWRQVVSLLRYPHSSRPTPAVPRPRGPSMSSLWSDLRFALRALRRAPFFSSMVIVTLLIGIGAVSAVFSLIYPVLLAEPPYPEPERLVMIWERTKTGERDNVGFLTGEDVRRESSSLASLALISSWGPVVQAGEEARRLNGARVSHQFFRTLGVAPWLGRDFAPEEDRYDTRQVVLLSHALWRRLYGGDSSIVGRTTLINGTAYLVAGVMPPGFRDLLSPQAELWAPLGYQAEQPWACRTCHHLRAVARLKPGVTLAAATRDVERVLAVLRARYPTEYGSVGAAMPTLRSQLSGDVRPPLLALFVAVALLLLLACANVGNLFLGRAGERENELAIRLALGAERGRLVRLVTLEAVVLSLLGGGLGVAAGWVTLKAVLSVGAIPPQLLGRITLAWPVLGFALVATALGALTGGTLPAVLAVRESKLADFRAGGRALLGRIRHRLRNVVVVAEVALAVLLLAGAGLQVRSLRKTLAVETGFEPERVAVLDVALRGAKYDSAGSTRSYYRALLSEAEALPGVASVAVTSQLPLGGNFDANGVHLEDHPAANPEEDPSAQRFAVSPGYFTTMGITVLRGRGFTPADREGAALVVVLNRSGVERLFGKEDPLGRRLKVGGIDGPWRTVVGIVEDVRHLSLEGPLESQVYLPFDQNAYEESDLSLVAQSRGGPPALAGLAGVARRLDAGVALSELRGMDEVIGTVVAPRRLALLLIGAFAGIAVALALGGLYGVIAASVIERVRELGLRAALGATPGRLVGMILARGLTLALAGTAIGLGGLLAAQRLLTRFVFGVPVGDPVTLVGVTLLLGAVALLACLVPAIRATRVDPLIAMRE